MQDLSIDEVAAVKHYEFPEIVLLPCEAEDVISTSSIPGVDDWDLPMDSNDLISKNALNQQIFDQ